MSRIGLCLLLFGLGLALLIDAAAALDWASVSNSTEMAQLDPIEFLSLTNQTAALIKGEVHFQPSRRHTIRYHFFGVGPQLTKLRRSGL